MALRSSCVALARWLAARDRSLHEAVSLALEALTLGELDADLRRDLSAWLESLGDTAGAAAVIDPLTSDPKLSSAETAHVLVRTGILKARAGDGHGAVAAFESALATDETEALAGELLGAMAGWDNASVSPVQAAEAFVEAARRRAELWQHDAVVEDQWRAIAADPTSEAAATALAATLDRRGRRPAADQVWRFYARALAPIDTSRAAAVHGVRRASAEANGDSAMALGALLDDLFDRDRHASPGSASESRLLELGGVDGPIPLGLTGDFGAQAAALERAAVALPLALRPVLLSAAAERHQAVGDASAAKLILQQALRLDPADVRCLATLANICMADGDRPAVLALERAVAAVGPRPEWCAALADALDALGDFELAIAWSQRCATLRPGHLRVVETLLDRLLRSGDSGRLSDTLAWLLSQPLALDSIAMPFGRALQGLSALDTHRSVVVARRGLDVFGPGSTFVRTAMLQAATGACDDAFMAAIFERWLSTGVEGDERQRLLVGLAELYERLEDEEAEARIVALAMRDEMSSPAIEAHIDRLAGRPATPDARLCRIEATAHRLAAREDFVASAHAWRELGAALWVLAQDRPGAIAAWQRAARTAPSGGYAALAVDLVTFAEPAFAREYLRQLVDGEKDDLTASSIAAEVARAALAQGAASTGLDLAVRGVARHPASAEALTVAEACALETRELATLSGLYDLVARRALGRFGRRAAQYRGARFFERLGDGPLTLKHAVQAFAALPCEGSSLQLLSRAAERAGDRTQAMRILEQVAAAAARSDLRSAWLIRAAAVAGEGGEGARRKVDVLLQAIFASPSVSTVGLLRTAIEQLLRKEPAERDAIEMRVRRAALEGTGTESGPQGARLAVAWARTIAETFDDADVSLRLLERALACDAEVEAFATLTAASLSIMARAADIGPRLDVMLTATESGKVPAGSDAMRVLGELATYGHDDTLRARAVLGAAVRDADDDSLVVAADAALRAHPGLATRAGRALTAARRVEALVSTARGRSAAGAHEQAAGFFERALDLVEGAARTSLEWELRAALKAGGTGAEERRIPNEAAGEGDDVRAERWMEVAERREARGELTGAVSALLEACKLDPVALGRWSALERVAEMAKDDTARILALGEIAKRVNVEGRVAVFKRLARAHAQRNDRDAAERAWREVLALDPADEDADRAIESAIISENRYSELAAHLAARAERLSADPGRSEAVRAVRLRRAAILEQRLGRVQDACDELALLLAVAPENAGALRYLADLQERRGDHAQAASLWVRAAAIESDPRERDTLELRAGRAAAAGRDFASAWERARAVLSRRPHDQPALELRCEAARALGQDRDLGDALEQLAAECPPSGRSNLLVDAALASARTGDLDTALARACLAADATPEQATPQLLARGLEYRRRGAGNSDEARQTLVHLSQVEGPMGGDDAALRSFLLAEALDVVRGPGTGIAELEAARELVGAHPLVALGLAERLAGRGETKAALDAFRVALGGPLLGLRSSGAVALAAADLAIRTHRAHDAAEFLDIAERFDDAAGAVKVRRERMSSDDSAPQQPRQTPVVAAPGESVPPTEDLRSAIHEASTSHERAEARLALARVKVEQGDLRAAEPLLREALGDGLVEAGDVLASLLSTSRDRARDILQVRFQQVALEPGSLPCLHALQAAALADDDRAHASAVEHVLRAFDHDAEPLEPPPLSAQAEQSGAFALLTRPSMDPAGEAFGLLWSGGWQIFARDPASYAITGVERVVPGATSALARLYEAAIRVLDAPRIPIFAPKASSGKPSYQVALLQPPAVIMTGDLRSESSPMRFEFGRGMAAALPQNVLRLGLSPSEGRVVLDALLTAFGPHEQGGRLQGPSARMAESFWQVLPPHTQRRMQRLLGGGVVAAYDDLVLAAQQSARRVGMFLVGDFAYAARVTVSECAPHVRLASAADLRNACEQVPQLADLLRLAVSPEYASARWCDGEAASGRSPSGRFSLF
jgi:tetratricopeptide (TPR) repeat protein